MHMLSTFWSCCMDRRRLSCRGSNGHVLPSKYASLSCTVNEKVRCLGLKYRRIYGPAIDVLLLKCVMESFIAQSKEH